MGALKIATSVKLAKALRLNAEASRLFSEAQQEVEAAEAAPPEVSAGAPTEDDLARARKSLRKFGRGTT
jgi:hypothetical protein